MSAFEILVCAGDGVGPEVMAEALAVLKRVGEVFGHGFSFEDALVGGACIDAHGVAVQDETIAAAKGSAAVLFGAVGHPRFDTPDNPVRPEQAILRLRRELELFANLRPVQVHPALRDQSPLRPERLDGTDLVVVRELTGGLYFAEPKKRWSDDTGRQAVDTLRYGEDEVRRVIRVACRLAGDRRKHVTSVDKANVLQTGRLWREIADEVAKEFPDITLEHMLVDAAAMHLMRKPSAFDVIVTENTFGDILTDEASMLAGSMGMMPSASLGVTREDGTGLGLYEPIHGSAPDIAGTGRANPVAMILSAAMLLRLSLGLKAEADAIEAAVSACLDAGHRTADIAGSDPAAAPLSTSQMGERVRERLG